MAEQDWGLFRALVKERLQDPQARKRIEQRTDIAPRTLSRWISGETEEPDRKRLLSLLAALPEHRDALLAAIHKALPDFEAPLIDPATRLIEDLPMDFWVRLLETNANTPRNLHFASVVNLIFLQLQSTVDPEHLGVQLTIAQCSPPTSADSPVLSLAFEMETFYAPERIRLRPMPEESIQHDRIAGFQQRVMTLLQGDLALTRLEAERAAWQEIQEELIALTLTLNQQRRR